MLGDTERSDVRWQWASRLAGMALALLAALLLLLQVRVSAGQDGQLGCGSSWDVISGRNGWREWWSADQAGASSAAVRPVSLARTLGCPDAINARIWLASAVFLAAVAVVAGGEFIAHRAMRRIPPNGRAPRRLHLVARSCVMVGAALTLAGLAGIALLTADPHDPLFLYVNRPAVVLVGLFLLSPAVLILALGLLALSAEKQPPMREADDGPG